MMRLQRLLRTNVLLAVVNDPAQAGLPVDLPVGLFPARHVGRIRLGAARWRLAPAVIGFRSGQLLLPMAAVARATGLLATLWQAR